jgi:hypothetical protein
MAEILAQGTKIGVKNGATYLELDAKSFSGPGGSAAIIDATTLTSLAKKKRLGLSDYGQLGLTLHYDPSNLGQQTLQDRRATKTIALMKMEFEDGSVIEFSGYVTVFSVSGAVDGLVEASATIEITGELTITPYVAPVGP